MSAVTRSSGSFVAGVLLIVHRAKFRPELNIVLLAFGICLTLASMFLAIHEATDNVPALPMPVALLVTVFIDALTAFALLFLTRECQTKTLLRFICTVLVVCVGIMLLINMIKVPWGRARMRLIYSTGNDTYFSNWWQAGTALKKKLVADGVSSDEFRSFPSGHTACAACSMLLILLPTLYRRLHDKEKLFMALGGVWTLVVAFSRLRMGMHFLSDVSVSSLLTIALGAVAVWLFYFNKPFFNKIWAFASGEAKPEKKLKKPEEP